MITPEQFAEIIADAAKIGKGFIVIDPAQSVIRVVHHKDVIIIDEAHILDNDAVTIINGGFRGGGKRSRVLMDELMAGFKKLEALRLEHEAKNPFADKQKPGKGDKARQRSEWKRNMKGRK